MKKLFKITVITILLTFAVAFFVTCSETVEEGCYVGYLDNSAPKVGRDLMQCEYGICLSSEVQKTQEHPEGGYSAAYCTKACESDADCESGRACKVVISLESISDMVERGYESPFAGKSFCVDTAAKPPTEAEIDESLLRFAEEKYADYLFSCEEEKTKDETEDCTKSLTGFCYYGEIAAAKPEYQELCCTNKSYVIGIGGVYCCEQSPPTSAEDWCCKAQLYIRECVKDENCKTNLNKACETNY